MSESDPNPFLENRAITLKVLCDDRRHGKEINDVGLVRIVYCEQLATRNTGTDEHERPTCPTRDGDAATIAD